jgi:uncharacterized membrane protein
MKEFALACGIGAISGSRSMLAPALVTNTGHGLPWPLQVRLGPFATSGTAGWVMALVAVAEMVADKSPAIPSRTEPAPLSGRMLTGAAAAAGCAPPGRRLRAAAAGAAGAAAATYGLYHLRRFVTTRLGVPDAAAGLAEDALAVGLGLWLMRRR